MNWIPKTFRLLPGPFAFRVAETLVIVVAILVGLHFFYSWLGNVLLDQGGTIG